MADNICRKKYTRRFRGHRRLQSPEPSSSSSEEPRPRPRPKVKPRAEVGPSRCDWRRREPEVQYPDSDPEDQRPTPSLELHEIPEGYVQWGEKHGWQDSEILEGSYLRCLGAEIFTPSTFYLNLYQNWHVLERFMANLQTQVKEQILGTHDGRYFSAASWSALYPGLYVLCFYESEWHRALVLSTSRQGQDQDKVQLQLIDYGTKWSADLSLVRYMLRDMLKDFPPQAIECSLKVGYPFPDQSGLKWKRKANQIFFNLIHNKYLGVTFHQRRLYTLPEDPTTYCGRWLVSMDVLVGEGHGPEVNLKEEFEMERGPKAASLGEAEPPGRSPWKKPLEAPLDLQADPSLLRHPHGEFATAHAVTNILETHLLKYLK